MAIWLWLNPALAEPEYSADGSRVFWFMQITDTHISTWFNNDYDESMTWALTDVVDAVDPWFVVVTGDLTDSTNGISYLDGPQLEEWRQYRGLATDADMHPQYYFDIPGNHDAYQDGPLAFYLEHSLSGRAFGSTQPSWRLEFTYGKYVFVSAATPDNDGPPWPGDGAIVTSAELAELERNLLRHGDADFTMMFGHHPIDEVANRDDWLDLMADYGIHDYACGHKHDFIIRTGDYPVMQYRIDSLGQGNSQNVGLYALDSHALSFSVSGQDDPWPAAVVTAPVAAELQSDEDEPADNIHAPGVPDGCVNAPVRVLAFDPAGVQSVRMRIGGGPWIDLQQRRSEPAQWRGYFNAGGLFTGVHELEVELTGGKTRSIHSNFRVISAACDIGEEDADEPLDDGEIITDPVLPDGDADEPVDGDEAVDGDETADGDEAVDGDETADGDDGPDGDEAVDGDQAGEVCENGETRCRDRLSVEICGKDGEWELLETCEGAKRCEEGECADPYTDGDDIADGDAADEADGDRAGISDEVPDLSGGGGGDGGCRQVASSSLPLFGLLLLSVVGRLRRMRESG